MILNGGNVGIGTPSPDTKLHVVGGIKVVDGSQGAGKVLTSDAAGLANWQAPASGGPAGGDLSGTYPNPTIALAAVDTAKIKADSIDSTKLLTGAVQTAKLATDAVTSATLLNDAASLGKVTAGGMVMSGGNVGIGTITPAVPLHVVNGTDASFRLQKMRL